MSLGKLSLQDSGALLASPVSPDVSAVQGIYNVLVANINLRRTMTQLQEVANLGSESEAMQSLRSQMKDANKTMLSQEQAMADLLGEITSMASSWSSLAMSVSLAQVPAAEMCEVLGLSRVLLKLKAVKEVEDCNVDALAEALDENLKNFSNQCGVEEEQATFERLRDELEQAKKDLSKLDEDLIEQELKLDEFLAENHFIMRQVRFLAEMEKVAGIQSDTMKALKEAHHAHQLSTVGRFGLDVLGDILLLGMRQFRNRSRKREQIAAEDYEDFKSNFDRKFGEVDSEEFAAKKSQLEADMEKKQALIKAAVASKKHLMDSRDEKHKYIEAKKVEVVAARSSVMKKLASIDTASVAQYKKVCDASMQFGQQRSRRGAFQMFASQAIKSIEAYHHFVGNLAVADWDAQKTTMTKIVSSECGWGVLAPALGYVQKVCTPLGLLMTGDPASKEDIPKLASLVSPATKLINALNDGNRSQLPKLADQGSNHAHSPPALKDQVSSPPDANAPPAQPSAATSDAEKQRPTPAMPAEADDDLMDLL